MPLSEGRFAAKCPLSLQKCQRSGSNRKERFAAIQKTEGKPCRDLGQDKTVSMLIWAKDACSQKFDDTSWKSLFGFPGGTISFRKEKVAARNRKVRFAATAKFIFHLHTTRRKTRVPKAQNLGTIYNTLRNPADWHLTLQNGSLYPFPTDPFENPTLARFSDRSVGKERTYHKWRWKKASAFHPNSSQGSSVQGACTSGRRL